MNPAQVQKKSFSAPPGEEVLAPDLLGPEKKPLRFGTRGWIRPIETGEIDQALGLFLADQSDSHRQISGKTASFLELAQQERYDLTRQIVAFYDDQLVHAGLFVPQPGGTAFVFLSRPASVDSEQWELAAQALRELCRWAFLEGSNLLQVLIEPTDSVRRDLCLAADFTRLTDLIYMFGTGDNAPAPERNDGDLRWLGYDQQHHDLFKQVIKQTYQGSQDCPELEELRNMEDVILCHKAAGKFDKRLWKLLIRGDNPVGALLLIPLRAPNAMELTYMGLCPGARGEGLGAFMLHEAIACARQYQNRILTLAVDCRNRKAYQLYHKFGLKIVLRRSVLIRS
ncbi:GNAT family N-acetyltransferase [Planctomycetota bacterium]